MKTHELKCHPPFFLDMKLYEKGFDVRYNDRNYQVGDLLIQKEYLPDLKIYTGNSLTQKVVYIVPGGQFGIEAGYVAMSVKNLPSAASRVKT